MLSTKCQKCLILKKQDQFERNKFGTLKSFICFECTTVNEKIKTENDNKAAVKSGYNCWQSMIRRCENKDDKDYPIYGGRGITVHKPWRFSFEIFLRDMGPRPSSKHSIDRENSNGNYEPGNCRWATMKTQQNNRRNNHHLTFNGETLTIALWADKTGIAASLIAARIAKGWSVKKTLTKPVRFKRKTGEK